MSGNPLESAYAQIRNVGRDIRHPAEIADRHVALRLSCQGPAGILGRRVERDVELAISGNLAARRVERQRLAGFAFEEPVPVFVEATPPRLDRHPGLVRLGHARFGLRRIGVRLFRVFLRLLDIGGGVRLQVFQFFNGARERFDLSLKCLNLRFSCRLGLSRIICPNDQNES